MELEKEGEGVKSLFPSYLLIFVLLIGTIFLVPNGVEGRVQRVANFDFAVFLALSIFVLARVNFYLGLLLIYLSGWIFLGSIPLESLYLILACVLVYIFIYFTDIQKEWIYNCICVIALLNVFWQVLQICGVYLLTYPQAGYESAYVGLMSNVDDTSAFLALCLIAFKRRKWKYGILVVLIGIVLTKAMIGVVAVGIIGLTFLRFDKKSLVFLIIGIIAICGFGKYEGFNLKSQLNTRGMIWKESAIFAIEKPFGWGLGQYKYIMSLMKSYNKLSDTSKKVLYEGINDKEGFKQIISSINKKRPDYFKKSDNNLWLQAHNEYVEVWFALGIVGLLLALVFIGNHIRTGFKMKDKIPVLGLIASLVTAMAFFTYHIMPLIILTVIYLSFIGRENGSIRKLRF